MITPKNEKNTAYTLFPTELLEAIKDSFSEDFEDQATKGSFMSLGRIYQSEIVLRLGYIKSNTISQINFDTSIETFGSEKNVISALENLVFNTKELFLDYFKNNNLENFSFYWNPLNNGVFYKYDATNTNLEFQANALLSEETKKPLNDLILGDMSDTEEIQKIVTILQTSHFNFK